MPTITVRLRDPNHPAGKRFRAGFTFSTLPSTVEVNPDQFQAIEADPYLKIDSPTETKAVPKKQAKNPEKTKKQASRMSKEELIEALEEKGQVSGQDFASDAKNEDLRALLQSL